MSVIDLRRRLDRIEISRHEGAPDRIFSDRPMDGDEAAGLLTNWRGLVASDEANLDGGVLCILDPEMTINEWEARHVTPH